MSCITGLSEGTAILMVYSLSTSMFADIDEEEVHLMKQQFLEALQDNYNFSGESITLGAAIYDGEAQAQALVKAPLKSFTRHGLIAGATGTGKTKTIQLVAEKLSAAGVPTLLMDLKGDLSGLAAAGESNKHIEQRQALIGGTYEPRAFPMELLTLSQEPGARLRATISEFGPTLLAKMLELNETQAGVLSAVFKFSDDAQLPLLDVKDLRKVLNFVTEEGEAKFKEHYGEISSRSVGTILRKLVELEQQGAEDFFGEPSFDVIDLCRYDAQGFGINSVIRLTDMQSRPKLFSSFMLSLLAEIYARFPEAGDLDKPKLVLFIDEAHLLFNNASGELLNQIDMIVKLIRSKGVGIFFCTQSPTDVPEQVLSQLGMKVQHALRAFTAKDRKNIKLTAENYPVSEFYKTDDLLTSLGIGEAAITVLDENGRPTMLAATRLCPPRSRMGVLQSGEINAILATSQLVKKYNQAVDRESAYEILTQQLQAQQTPANDPDFKQPQPKRVGEPDSLIESLSKNTMVRRLGNTLVREVTRGLLGVLGLKK